MSGGVLKTGLNGGKRELGSYSDFHGFMKMKKKKEKRRKFGGKKVKWEIGLYREAVEAVGLEKDFDLHGFWNWCLVAFECLGI